MKNLKHFLLISVLLLAGLGAKAHDFKVGNVYYEIISSQDQTVRVVWTWINKTSSVAKERYRYEDQTEINIPNNVTYNGKTYAVIEIQQDAFNGTNSKIKSVTLHANLKTIGSNAFKGLTKLKSITIPTNVTSIGSGAFDGCTGLDTVTWKAKTVTDVFKGSNIKVLIINDNVETINGLAFSNCKNLKTVSIGKNVTKFATTSASSSFNPFYASDSIETLYYNAKNISTNNYNSTFQSKKKLKTVIIGDSVQTLPDQFLKDCSALTSVNIPPTISVIPTSCFESCSSLKNFTIPNTIDTIMSDAFSYSGLDTLVIPDSVLDIQSRAFYSCSNLKSVSIGNNISNIGGLAFSDCKNLKTVTIGKNVTALHTTNTSSSFNPFYASDSIETLYYNAKNISTNNYNSTFQSKKKLKTVIIGDSVQTLPSNFISGCTGIDTVISHARTAPTAQSNSFSQVKKDIPVMVPCGSQDSYKSANYWKEFTNIQTKTYDTSVTMSLCYGEIFNSRTAMQSGVFVDTLQSTDGCDSIVTINLTVFPVYDTAIYVTTIVDEKGEDYYDTVVNNLQTINGCDSVVTTITFHDYDNSIDTIYNNLTASICQGEVYSFNNNELNASGIYTQTVNVNKYRDSIITLTLTVNPTYDTVISATICKGQTYNNNGFNTNEAGTHTLNLNTINGCDSIVTLNLNVVDGYDTTITAEICSSESFGENSYGIYVKNLVSSDGCDSIVRVNLVAKQYTGDIDTVHIHDTVTVTQIDTVTLHDTITNEITKFDTVTLHDTIETTLYDTVTLFDTIETTLYDTVTLHDTIETTLYDTVTLFDTIETTLYDTVTLFDTIETTLYDTVTLFDTIETTLYDTVTLFDTITVTQTVHDTVNTVDTLTVTEYDTVTLIDTITLTQIDTVTVTDTITLTQIDTVTVTDTITLILHDTVNTIDTVYLHDTITPCGITRTYIYAEINAGETYMGYGFTESDAGEYTLNLQTEDGCDSIVTLILQVTAGIDEIQAERIISIYPNPAHEVVTLDIGRLTLDKNDDITIVNNSGQVVYKSKIQSPRFNINVSDFEAGVYYINVGKHTQPLIIE